MSVNTIVIGSVSIEVAAGELAEQSDIDAVAILVNPMLTPVGSPSQRVFERAGAEFAEHCRSLRSTESDDTIVVTKAFGLALEALLLCRELASRRHPMYVDDLAFRYGRLLRTSDDLGIRSLALEPLGGGAKLDGVWSEAGIVVQRLRTPDSLTHLRKIRFVFSKAADAQRFLSEIISSRQETPG